MIYIFAPSKQIAEAVAKKEGLSFNKWHYGTGRNQMLGVRHADIWLVNYDRSVPSELYKEMIEDSGRNNNTVIYMKY